MGLLKGGAERLKQAAESRTQSAAAARERFEQRIAQSGLDEVIADWGINPGLKNLGLKNALSELRKGILDGERVLAVTAGDWDTIKALQPCLAIALTDQRLLVVGASGPAGEWGLESIDEVQGGTKLMRDWIEWGARRKQIRAVRNVPTGHGARFVAAFDAARSEFLARQQPSVPTQPQASVADELKKLAELRDAGVLTAEEFDARKAQLLT